MLAIARMLLDWYLQPKLDLGEKEDYVGSA